jgi:uncharacterized protein
MRTFGSIAFTSAVRAEQERHGSRSQYARIAGRTPEKEGLGPTEQQFVSEVDGFYMASVSESGWPYVQYRGGLTGFLRVLDDHTLGFADFRGNRQYISVGNLKHGSRVALILMDYARQIRMKLLGTVEIHEGPTATALIESLRMDEDKSLVERAFVIRVEAFDWNCQQHITPRFTEAQVREATTELRKQLQDLEQENQRLRALWKA